jgi:hypothetical protein
MARRGDARLSERFITGYSQRAGDDCGSTVAI